MKEFLDYLINGFYGSIMNIDWNTFSKLCISAIVGLVIGLERELRRKPTGVKTLLIIAVSSCLLTIVSIKSVVLYSTLTEHITMDPLRLPAQIVSGIGFIGAGVIFRRQNDVVSGLTTAAIVWGVGGIGIAIGANFITEAILATLFFLIAVEVLPWLIQKTTKVSMNDKVIILKLTITACVKTSEIMEKIKQCEIKVKNVKVKEEKENRKTLEIRGYVPSKVYVTSIFDEISSINGINNIEISE